MVVGLGFLIYYCASDTDRVGKLLNSRPLVALGNWSYSIYLWHAPGHYAVMAAFAAIGYPVTQLGLTSSRVLLLTTTLAVVTLSAFSYRYLETPSRRFLVSVYSLPDKNRLGRRKWSLRRKQAATGLGAGNRSVFGTRQTSHPVRRHRTCSD